METLPKVIPAKSERPLTATGTRTATGPFLPHHSPNMKTQSPPKVETRRERSHSLPLTLQVVDLEDGSLLDDEIDHLRDIRSRAEHRQSSAAQRLAEERAELDRLRAQLKAEKLADESRRKAARTREREILEFNLKQIDNQRKQTAKSRTRSSSSSPQPGGILYRRPSTPTENKQKLDQVKAEVRTQMKAAEQQKKEEKKQNWESGASETSQWRKELEEEKRRQMDAKMKKTEKTKADLDIQIKEQKLEAPAVATARATEMPALKKEVLERQSAMKKEQDRLLRENMEEVSKKLASNHAERARERQRGALLATTALEEEERRRNEERQKTASLNEERRKYFAEELQRREQKKKLNESAERAPTATGLAVGEKKARKRRYVHPRTDLTATVDSTH